MREYTITRDAWNFVCWCVSAIIITLFGSFRWISSILYHHFLQNFIPDRYTTLHTINAYIIAICSTRKLSFCFSTQFKNSYFLINSANSYFVLLLLVVSMSKAHPLYHSSLLLCLYSIISISVFGFTFWDVIPPI